MIQASACVIGDGFLSIWTDSLRSRLTPSRMFAASLLRQPNSVRGAVVAACLLTLVLSRTAAAQAGVLNDCMALTANEDEIHNCLDNTLDVMDDNLNDITDFIRRESAADTLAAFERSQSTFEAFRRENCLWYLAINAPRSTAELVAKDCLVRLSQERLSELQRLLSLDTGAATGASDSEPADTPASTVDQRALGEERRELPATEPGLDERAEPEALSSLDDAAVGGAAVDLPEEGASTNPVSDPEPLVIPPEATTANESAVRSADSVSADNGERLTAYFGAWLADCSGSGSGRCRLEVDMTGGSAAPTLALEMQATGAPSIELSLPGRELESTRQILWGIDAFLLGAIEASRLDVVNQLSLQTVTEPYFVREELLPMMRRGNELRIEIGSAADGGAARYRATLIGLTRAISFANDYLGL